MRNHLEENFNSPFRIIRRFIRVANFYGYNVSICNRHTGSCYVSFCKQGKNTIDFIFRFSDHFLRKGNWIPAGVINQYTNIKHCIRDIQFYNEYYKKMSSIEKEELWENRYLHF